MGIAIITIDGKPYTVESGPDAEDQAFDRRLNLRFKFPKAEVITHWFESSEEASQFAQHNQADEDTLAWLCDL
jgi:hypothetical protein